MTNSLGGSLADARKKSGLSQEAVAERLGISRQTIGKWESSETLPDIRQAKRLAVLYGTTLDELIDFDLEVSQIEDAIAHTSQEVADKVDWTKVWAQQYPVLATYRDEVDTAPYAQRLQAMLDELRADYGYSELDALLVLKDILGTLWNA